MAEKTNLGLSTIKRAEAKDGPVSLTRANQHLLISALESLGVQFIASNKSSGEGVRFAPKNRLKRRSTDR